MVDSLLSKKGTEMKKNYLPGSIVDALVPISRFNKGEASKIFDEVHETGCKIVLKNNTPTCIMLSPERYQEIVDMIDDQYLLAVAEERVRYSGEVTYTFEEILAKDGLTLADIDALEDVEIE